MHEYRKLKHWLLAVAHKILFFNLNLFGIVKNAANNKSNRKLKKKKF